MPENTCADIFATRFNRLSRLYNRLERISLDLGAGPFADQLTPLNPMPGCLSAGVVAIAVVKNEAGRVQHFLDHYRWLGVTGFVLIDNGSGDGTLDHLLGQPDCHVIGASASYAKAGFGSRWINAAVDLCGLRDRWLITADADELLVYDDCEHHRIDELAMYLEGRSLLSLPCLMLDVYDGFADDPSRGNGAALIAGRRVMFDGNGYGRNPSFLDRMFVHRALRIDGGPRARRMFSKGDKRALPYLHKVPFMRWSSSAVMRNSHEADPIELNFAPVRGALIHLKLLELDRLADPARLETLEHWNGGAQYKRYIDRLESEPGMSFVYEGSRWYDGSASLAGCGLVSRLEWPR